MAMDNPSVLPSLDVWTSALLSKSSAGRGSNGKLEAYGIKKLRELILELAVRGKLVPQDSKDEPASELLKKSAADKAKPMRAGKANMETLPAEADDDEMRFTLPKSWTWILLGSLSEILDSQRKPITKTDRNAGAYPYYGASGVVDYVAEYIFDEPLVLVGEDGAKWGRGDSTAFSISGKTWVNNHAHVLRPNRSCVLDSYLVYFLTVTDLNKYITGMTVPKLNQARLVSIPVALPPLAEQHRIVAKVDELMALCDQLEQQQTDSLAAHQTLVETLLGTLTRVESQQEFSAAWARIASHFDTLFTTEASIDQLKQALLQLAVMGKLVPQDPNDEPAAVLLKRIAGTREQLVIDVKAKKQNDHLKIDGQDIPFTLPENWAWTRFENLINPEFPLSYGVLVPGPDVDGGVPFARIEDLDIKNPPEKPAKSIAEDIDAKYGRTRLMGGEILMGVVGSIGKLGVAPNSWKGANIARAVCRIMPTDSVNKQFVVCLLQSEFMQVGFLGDTRTLAQPTLNIGLIRAALTPLPPLAEQHRIVAKVDELMALCDALKARLADAQAIQLHLADAIVEQAVC